MSLNDESTPDLVKVLDCCCGWLRSSQFGFEEAANLIHAWFPHEWLLGALYLLRGQMCLLYAAPLLHLVSSDVLEKHCISDSVLPSLLFLAAKGFQFKIASSNATSRVVRSSRLGGDAEAGTSERANHGCRSAMSEYSE